MLLGKRDHIPLVLAQGQGTLKAVGVVGVDHVGVVVRSLGVVAGDEHQSGSAVGRGEQLIGVDAGRSLADLIGGEVLGHGGEHGGEDVARDRHAEEHGDHAIGVHFGAGVQVDELLVQGEALLAHGLLDAVKHLAGFKIDEGGGAHHAAQNRVIRVHAPESHALGCLVQGQRGAVVLQQNNALRRNGGRKFLLRGDHFLQRGIVGSKVGSAAVFSIVCNDNLIVARAKHAVDLVGPSVGGCLRGHCEHQQRCHQCGKAAPESSFCHSYPSFQSGFCRLNTGTNIIPSFFRLGEGRANGRSKRTNGGKGSR